MNSQISNKIKNNKNKDKDKVYTPKEVAEDCMNKIKYKITETDHLYEPFYGTGVFYNLFGDNPKSYTEIDLGLDFFEIDNDIETDYIITNPPYSIMTDIINKIIKTTAKENETIIDVFAGSGTTAYVAKTLGYNSVSYEVDKKYCDIIKRRVGKI